MSAQDRSSLESAAAHWDQRFQAEASVEQRAGTYALASPTYQRLYVNPRFSSDGTDWVEWVRRKLCPAEPLARALVLGCGLGDGLLDFQRRGLARRLHGIDLSAAAIEEARAATRRARLEESVTFEVGDFHTCALEREAYDVVLLVMSLHHALDLDAVLARVHAALKPGGACVANEYVGPDRWQHTWTQLFFIKALLTLLPRSLRRRQDGTTKGRIGRPTLAWMLATDPSEAAHSADIPETFARRFELRQRVDYGGGVAVPVLDEIMANFDERTRARRAWLRLVLGTDRLAGRLGLVPSANAVLLGHKPADAR